MVFRETVNIFLDAFLVNLESIPSLVFAEILFLFKIIGTTHAGVQQKHGNDQSALFCCSICNGIHDQENKDHKDNNCK